MNKSEEFLKNDSLIKKYSNKPFPTFLKYMGNIKTLAEYEDWLKEQNKIMLRWIGSYLIVLPFFIFFCLSASGMRILLNPPLKVALLAEGISILWYLSLTLIKDIRGVIKNG